MGEYSVTWRFNQEGHTLQYPDGTTERFKNRADAQAAAQKDFDGLKITPKPEVLSFDPDEIPF
ncbi:hypothetical protein ACNSPG_06495 [Brucella pituitosa]|uniref:hypothetical protein n=1 Tax=Brucella pituitosa TaxID=571256 RepID=UPI003C731ABF